MTGRAQKDMGLNTAGGALGGAGRVARPAGAPIRIVPTVLNADAYDSGDVLFDFTEVALAVDALGGAGVIDQICIYDKDDQAAAAWVMYFAPAVTALGTKDSAPSIADADVIGAGAGLGLKPLAIASTDFVDVGGCKMALKSDLKIVFNAAAASRSLFIAATVTGTPTQTTGGIVIDVWVH